MKRRISHGQAMRSIFGRDRVTQTVRPRASRFGILSAATVGSSAFFQPMTAFENLGGDAAVAKPRGGAFAELLPLLADHDDGLAGEADAQSWTSRWERRLAPGINRGSAAKSSSMRTSMSVGALAVPMSRESFSDEIEVYDDMLRPW